MANNLAVVHNTQYPLCRLRRFPLNVGRRKWRVLEKEGRNENKISVPYLERRQVGGWLSESFDFRFD